MRSGFHLQEKAYILLLLFPFISWFFFSESQIPLLSIISAHAPKSVMGRSWSKAKAKQAKPVGNQGSAHTGRVDPPRVNTALPLDPTIQCRFPKVFDAESYASPSQKAISRVIYILYSPYLQSSIGKPLSHLESHRLVQENHAEAMSQIQSGERASKANFWIERDTTIIEFDPRAVKAVREMPIITVSVSNFRSYFLPFMTR